MKRILLALTIASIFSLGYSQEKTEEFKPSGKPFVKVFTNFHSTFDGDENYNQFVLERAYLGYAYKLSKNLSGKVTLDIGNPKNGSSLERTAYLKTAYLEHKGEKFKAKFGLIGLNQFAASEKLWGNRYLYKSFQDKHKFGTSADVGVYAEYKIIDLLSVDAAITNGEGYKKEEADSLFKYSAGMTINPIEKIKVRTYYDIIGAGASQQQVLAFFAGFDSDKFDIGAEYNMLMNKGYKKDKNLEGISAFASYKFEKFRIFGRFDHLYSNKLKGEANEWNFDDDGQAVIGGLEFKPSKGFKVSPNVQAWIPKDINVNPIITAYVSCEIKF